MGNSRIVLIGGVGSAEQFGGELTKNKNIVSQLRKFGYKVSVIDTHNGRHSFIKLSRIAIAFVFNLVFRPRAVFVFSSSYGNILPMLKLMFRFPIKHKTVYWGIGGVFSAEMSRGRFDPKYLRGARMVIVEGGKMKRELNRCGISSVEVIPNFKRLGQLPSVPKFDDGLVHFVFLSRIIPDKGVGYILDCVRRLNEMGYAGRFAVDFYGSVAPDYAKEFDTALESLPNVRYCNTLQLADWNNYSVLARYHAMLFPTYWHGEGFPGVIVDAYVAGLPVIASDWNFNEEFIEDGVTGVVVPTHDTDALLMAMKRMSDGGYDLDAMSRNCRREASEYDVDKILNRAQIERILD
ncbi:MAG: glycosyltransferase [Alistipes sp.]|nr:glycosyltransferase [Alistipes sp.]